MEGNMRGPSTADCEKSFAHTGIPSVNLLAKKDQAGPSRLVQIQLVPAITGTRLSQLDLWHQQFGAITTLTTSLPHTASNISPR